MNIVVQLFCGVDLYAAKITIINLKGLTNRHYRLTNDHSLVVFLFELTWSHACEGLEGTKEGTLRGEARLRPDL